MTIGHLGLQDLTLDFDHNDLEHITIVQGDTKTRGFRVLITDQSGSILTPAPGFELRLYGTNSNYPDKTYFTVAETVDNYYHVYITTDMASAEGTLSLQLALFKGDTELIQSRIKEVPIHRSIAQGGQIGQDLVVDFTRLTEAIARVGAQEEAYTQSLITQEAIRQDVQIRQADVTSKHGQVTQMHQSLQSVFDSEQGRVSAESGRVSAESARVTAENTRDSNENTRKSSEDTRISDEDTRKSNENTRISNEDSRESAETGRINAESARVTAEQGRVSAESQRQIDEDKRFELYNALLVLQEALGDSPVTALTEKVLAMENTVEGQGLVLDTKVTQETGKGLSTNDYTDAEKAKVADIDTKQDKLTAGDNIDITGDTISAVDTITTINGKTGAISKADITALGIPSQDTVYQKPASEPISYIQGLQAELDSKVESYGTNSVMQIAVINAGGSTTGIPNNTLILELE